MDKASGDTEGPAAPKAAPARPEPAAEKETERPRDAGGPRQGAAPQKVGGGGDLAAMMAARRKAQEENEDDGYYF